MLTLNAIAMCLFVWTPAMVAALPAADAREIIRRTVAADERNWKIARHYGFSERVDARRNDDQGRLKSKEVKTYDVSLLQGSPYRRLSGRDDGPLPPAEEEREQAKLTRSVEERRKESARQRMKRLTDYGERPDWQRDAWREFPDAMDFRLTPDEVRDGHAVYVIEATPRQGYRPRSSTGKALGCLHVKLWIDKQDYHLARMDLEAVDTITLGLFLFRIAKGARVLVQQDRLTSEVWLPQRIHVVASVRVGLLSVIHIDHEITYGQRREFDDGSVVLSRKDGSPIEGARRRNMVK